MAIPPTAAAFAQGLDPHEELDFVIPCAPLLEIDEAIDSYELTPLAEAVALGLTIMTGGGRDHARLEDNRSILMWLEIDDAFETNAAFDGAGVRLPMEVTIVTDSYPARTRQITLLVPVAQK